MVLGFAVLVGNAVAAGWGGMAWLRRSPSVAFWYLLRVAQALVIGQVALGLLLLAEDRRPAENLHYLYGIAPLVVSLVTEGMRAGAVQREMDQLEGDIDSLERREQIELARRAVRRETGVMTVGALLIVTLSLRAISSGGY